MNRTLRWHDYITLNINYLGLSMIAQTLSPLVVPLLVQQFVGEAQKASFYGAIRLWGLMVALLAQAFWGMLSDRSALRWGRRRPFIFLGTLTDLVFIVAIGLSANLSGVRGYWTLFAMYLLLQIASNAAQGAQQGLIPDLVPQNRRGRASAVKALFEAPLPLILVSFTVAKLIGAGDLWGGLLVMMAAATLSMLITLLVHEDPLGEKPPALDWTPLLRLVLMTGLFTVIILGMGEVVKRLPEVLALNHAQDQAGVKYSTATLFVTIGLTGILAMAAAVALGVWVSVRISVGPAARENPSFTWWVVNRLAFLAGAFNLSTFAVYFLQARLGLVREKAAGPAALLMLLVGIFVLIFALVGGWLTDRFSHKRIVAIAGVVAALGTLIAILSPSLTIIYVGGCLIGMATGMFYTANWALGTELVPQGEAGRYLGISNLAGAGAGAVGAYIGGPIADYVTIHVPDVPGLGYVLLFAIYGALFLLSVVALVRVREPERPSSMREADKN